MALINYSNKVTLDPQPGVAEENKVTPANMNDLKNGINGLGGTILWQNPSPSSNFGSQSITLSSSNYDELRIYCLGDTGGTIVLTMTILKGYGTRFLYASEGSFKYWSRTFNYSTDTSLTVNNCIEMTSGGGTNANGLLIPLIVVGLKTDINV